MFDPRTSLRKAKSFLGSLMRRFLFLLCERLLPADDKLWCFCTWDRHFHTLDNPRAVFEAVKDDASVVKIVLQKTRSRDGSADVGASVRLVYAESLLGAWYLARSRVVLLGYALPGMTSYSDGLTSKHLIVQLWHGVPLRRVGKLHPGRVRWESETPKYSAMVASSEQERDHLGAAFAPIPHGNIWLTGLPRNDFILEEEGKLPGDYRIHLERLRSLLSGRKLVLYAPTWRDRESDMYFFSKEERQRLEPLLETRHAVLGIRGHANVRHFAGYAAERDSSTIVSLDEIPDVNVVLRETAVLITDYSSIYIDFLLTNRPIIHFAYDLEAYTKDRGSFLYDLDRAFAGPVATNFEELLSCLDAALDRGVVDQQRYIRTRDLFHRHGAQSGSEVAKKIQLMVRSSVREGRRLLTSPAP